ncbi:uncharacterized protein G2W53_025983 [Senna tora]|uniref:Uncharacterized protein n=1 Tax=Senna tora TaxID=362788 RepID=A0A834TE95_9FABA|nr:uncharacterized protein G2W53_025983 [Senna tora]
MTNQTEEFIVFRVIPPWIPILRRTKRSLFCSSVNGHDDVTSN